jgi:ribosomal protein S18 acetylase RimI-like enzyme
MSKRRDVDPGVVVRAGAASDAAALAELAARTFRDTFAADTRPEDIALHEAESYGVVQQGRELRDPDTGTLLVEYGNELVGFAQLRFSPPPDCVSGENPVEVWRFYLARQWHGRGVAHELMQAVESEALRRGARTMWLGVWERNERAKAFYYKKGFKDAGAHIYMVGTDAQTDRILVRPLSGVDCGTSP